jgi:hypothetical protein
MKNGNGVMPYMRIGNLAENIQEKSNVHNNLKEAKALQQVSSVPLWSRTLTSSVVTRYAEGILHRNSARKKYKYCTSYMNSCNSRLLMLDIFNNIGYLNAGNGGSLVKRSNPDKKL